MQALQTGTALSRIHALHRPALPRRLERVLDRRERCQTCALLCTSSRHVVKVLKNSRVSVVFVFNSVNGEVNAGASQGDSRFRGWINATDLGTGFDSRRALIRSARGGDKHVMCQLLDLGHWR